jgi:hypothetical protein
LEEVFFNQLDVDKEDGMECMFYFFARFDLPRLFYRFLGLRNVVLKIKEIHNSMAKMATAPLFSVAASSTGQIRPSHNKKRV